MRRLIFVLLGVVVGFVIGSGAIAGLNYWAQTRAPTGPHPHVAYLKSAIAAGGSSIDFKDLNSGEWSWLCLYGVDQKPLDSVERRLGERKEDYPIAPEIRRWFGGDKGPASLGPDEGALAVVDPQGFVAITRFAGFPTIARLTEPACAERSQPVVSLTAK